MSDDKPMKLVNGEVVPMTDEEIAQIEKDRVLHELYPPPMSIPPEALDQYDAGIAPAKGA